jgi:sulfur relay (sulfurtransferase) complex TusBCD TusD component (DsrE family)
MKPRVLLIVTGDPRSSPRVAEAVRIAAGVGAWEKVDVSVYLRGEAVRVLDRASSDLIEEENYAHYWPILAECSQPIYVQKNAGALRGIEEAALGYKEIGDDELAALAAAQNYVMRF